ncbi:uncharacterized protein LOC121968592 [Zingiber officinale]|nr:uncharacterized protein LOC121968592 [Zingiber officinale]
MKRLSTKELGKVEPSQPSHLSPPVSQPASSLGKAKAEAELVQSSQRCRSLSKDSESLEVAPAEPPTNLAQSPQPSTTTSGPPRSDSRSRLLKYFKEQPSAFSAKIPASSQSMPPPEAWPSLVTPEQCEAMRSMSTTELGKYEYSLLCQLLVCNWELMERIKPLSADYAESQAQETKLRSLAEYWEKKAKAVKAEKSYLSEQMTKVLIELDKSKAESEETRSKVEGVSAMLEGAMTKLEGARTELQLVAKEKASLAVKLEWYEGDELADRNVFEAGG